MNVLGDLLLVGVLHLGVGGAAAATVVAQIASVILTFLFLAREEHLRGKVHVWHLHFGREHMVMMIRTGFPLALQSMLFPIANSIVQASVNTMGTDSIAAWSICDKLSMLIWLLADSMGPAIDDLCCTESWCRTDRKSQKRSGYRNRYLGLCGGSRQSVPVFWLRMGRPVVY